MIIINEMMELFLPDFKAAFVTTFWWKYISVRLIGIGAVHLD